jgi:mono/diheme cytochrome c family protein
MRKLLKWIGIVLGSLIGLLVLVVVGLIAYGQLSFKPAHADRPLYSITADTSSEGLARGEYLMESVMGCTQACHSPEGRPFVGVVENIDEGPIAVVFAVPNLTPDRETGLGNWTDAEIARAIREGVDRGGVELVVMPSYNYHALSDADVAAMVGYLRNLEPVSNAIPPFQANAIAKVMLALGMFGPKTPLNRTYRRPARRSMAATWWRWAPAATATRRTYREVRYLSPNRGVRRRPT